VEIARLPTPLPHPLFRTVSEHLDASTFVNALSLFVKVVTSSHSVL